VYDSQGGAHTVQMDFLKTTTADTWNVEINAVPASDVDPVAAPNGNLAAGTITFNPDGSFNSTSLVATSTPATPTTPAPSTAAAGVYSLSIPWAANLG